jgi:hypothetical protein
LYPEEDGGIVPCGDEDSQTGPESDSDRGHSCDGAQGQGGPWGARKGAPRSPRKAPGKEAAHKRAVKAKEK